VPAGPVQVVATAGHVDHGKSTLVRALTGTDPDRWEEERRRGLTIDLGFAWTRVGPGEGEPDIAFVDVPGHQRFLANMLAGVGPVPAVLFAVAADEGWRRQSGEHLAALCALGVRRGLVAVTRSDRADPAAAAAQAAEQLAGTPLAGSPTVAVSALTGLGLPELRAALATLADGLPVPDPTARVRLWVDRAFTVGGTGTVVTGTLSAGTLRVGDELETEAGPVHVRRLETLGTQRQSVAGVARVAVALRGIERARLRRGDQLLTPGAWSTTATLDVRLSVPADLPAADLPAELVLHVGAAAVPARVRPLGDGTLARLTLAHPLPLTAGDRALLRDPGRQSVAAGALVLDADPAPLRRRGAATARAAALAAATGRPDPATEIARRGLTSRRALTALGVLTPGETVPAGVREVRGQLVAPATWAGWTERLPALVADHLDRHPLDTGAPREDVRRALGIPDAALLDAVVAEVTAAEQVAPIAGGRLGLPGRSAALPPAASAGLQQLQAVWARGPVAAPDAPEVQALGLSGPQLGALAAAGLLLRLPGDVLLAPGAADAAVAALRGLPQPFTVSAARQALGSSRRVVVPLLEHLDARGRTRRQPDGSRVLR